MDHKEAKKVRQWDMSQHIESDDGYKICVSWMKPMK